MADTARAYAALAALFPNNTSAQISPQDLRDFLASVLGQVGALTYVDVTGTAAAIAAQSDGTTNLVEVAPATDLDANSQGFDESANGRLRYTGAPEKLFKVTAVLTYAPAEATDEFVFGLAKGGTLIAGSRVFQEVAGAGDKATVTLQAIINLASTNYVSVFAGNMTDAGDLTIHALSLIAEGYLK